MRRRVNTKPAQHTKKAAHKTTAGDVAAQTAKSGTACITGGFAIVGIVALCIILAIAGVAIAFGSSSSFRHKIACSGHFFSFIARWFSIRCDDHGIDIGKLAMINGTVNPEFFYNYAKTILRKPSTGVGGLIIRSPTYDAAKERHASFVPYCIVDGDTGSAASEAKDVLGATFLIIGNDNTRKRLCARILLADGFPGSGIFDTLVHEAFHGTTDCARVARNAPFYVMAHTYMNNCEDIKYADVKSALWTYPTNKTRFYTPTCTHPASGGLLTLQDKSVQSWWCNDLYSILTKGNFTEANTYGSILYDVIADEIPDCSDYASLTLWNSYNQSCRPH